MLRRSHLAPMVPKILCSILGWVLYLNEALSDEVPFHEVAAILQTRCVGCHSGKDSDGGYDLSRVDTMVSPGDSSKLPIVFGKPGESELYRRLITSDPSERMPEGGQALPPHEIDLLRRWIEQCQQAPQLESPSIAYHASSTAVVNRIPEIYPTALPASSIALFPDGKTALVGGYGEVLEWSLSSMKLVRRWQGVGKSVTSIALSNDQRWIYVASGTAGRIGIVQAIDRNHPEKTPILVLTSKDIPCELAVENHSGRLGIACRDGSIHILDFESRKFLLEATPHADAVLGIAWDRSGERLGTASRDRTARALNSRSFLWVAGYDRHERAVSGVTFWNDYPITLDETGTLRLWNRENGNSIEAEQAGFDRRANVIRSRGDLLYIPGTNKVEMVGIEWKEILDDKDKEKKKKRKKATFEKRGSLLAKPDALFVSLSVNDDGTVLGGTQEGILYLWGPVEGEGPHRFLFELMSMPIHAHEPPGF